ncbi:hypothetical protein Ngar_c16850 [Candidatus Nitrososphaera gargensis Ga9.2]|uniref:Uncharacterized protein n=1 Tax=Nitrososphaera gargensis (strain Ga9.2) TaxID=1237085 RepID=K0II47_NITGG|nr:hypothetical protein Ngar_c16850 [Candidatus Nitrososphaera gargensis Ga9.2]
MSWKSDAAGSYNAKMFVLDYIGDTPMIPSERHQKDISNIAYRDAPSIILICKAD